MKISFYGAAKTVTGSCYLLECSDSKILIDCGMFQGSKVLFNINTQPFPFNISDVDAMILTHAHMDHSGRIPKLYKDGYKNSIFATDATIDLCRVMLEDSAHIQEMETEYQNRKNKRKGVSLVEPMYNVQDAIDCISLFKHVNFSEIVNITDNVSFRFLDAGHMLGSCIIEIWDKDEKIVFSGDLGNLHMPLLNDPQTIDNCDYLVLESTYGDRVHEDVKKQDRLLDIIKNTAKKGGNIIIPAFSVGRTQEVLFELNKYKENNLLDEFEDIEVIVDSPMAIKATEIFKKYYNLLNENTKSLINSGDDPLVFDNLRFTLTTDESKAINFEKGSKIIISASGMCDAGRIRHHIKHNVYDEKNTIVFVGYQAKGTLGQMLQSGVNSIKMFGENIVVKANIESIDAFSGHADKNTLLNWVSNYNDKLKKIVLVHGETSQLEGLKDHLTKANRSVEIANYKSTYNLTNQEFEDIGEIIPIPEPINEKEIILNIEKYVEYMLENKKYVTKELSDKIKLIFK